MGKKTYQRVVDLLNEHIPANVSRNEFCRITGINRNSVDRYRSGVGCPIHETLEKMAGYFGVSVEYLKGEGEKSLTVDPLMRGKGKAPKSSKSQFPTIRALHPRDGNTIESYHVIDAPTQEVINDMKKMSESDRWVFVGRVKPIVRELIENSSKSEG